MYVKVNAKESEILHLKVPWPLLPGSLSTVMNTCGKSNCACKADPPRLHGVYYRWTGFLGGKRTTRTLTKEQSEECRRRIQNYRELQRQLDSLLAKALAEAPWTTGK